MPTAEALIASGTLPAIGSQLGACRVTSRDNECGSGCSARSA